VQRRTKIVITSAACALALATATGVAVAASAASDDAGDDQPITGAALEQASDAALAHTGGGQVTDTEVDDEESYYEVEVTLADGTEVDVQLDESFNVVGDKTDRNDGTGDADDDDATDATD
jgi:uncharacterized membrane protein YkoI